MKQAQDYAIRMARDNKLAFDMKKQLEHNKNKSPSNLKENATVYWRKPTLKDIHSNKKLQSNISQYIAFNIHHDSCQLRDPVTKEVYKHRVSIDQLIYPRNHAQNSDNKQNQNRVQ